MLNIGQRTATCRTPIYPDRVEVEEARSLRPGINYKPFNPLTEAKP